MKHLQPYKKELSPWTQALFFPIHSRFNFQYDPTKMAKLSSHPLFDDFNEYIKSFFINLGYPIYRFQSHHSGCSIIVYGNIRHKELVKSLTTGKNKTGMVTVHIEEVEAETGNIIVTFVLHWTKKGFFR